MMVIAVARTTLPNKVAKLKSKRLFAGNDSNIAIAIAAGIGNLIIYWLFQPKPCRPKVENN